MAQTFTITAASQSGSNTTYTYTLSTLTYGWRVPIGASVVITLMAHGVNNGTFVVTVGSPSTNTFTVVNASGVTATETGTGSITAATVTFAAVPATIAIPLKSPDGASMAGWPCSTTPTATGYWPVVPAAKTGWQLTYRPGQIFPSGGENNVNGQIFP